MEKKFKIELPELTIKKEQLILEGRARFTNDFDRGGILTQVFVFTYLEQPSSATNITDALSQYYHTEFDRTKVFRSLDRLVKLGLIYTTTSGDVITTPEEDRKEIHKKIFDKFQKFMEKIPAPFRKRYSNVNYYWTANGFGLEFIEHCCKLLNFKCKTQK